MLIRLLVLHSLSLGQHPRGYQTKKGKQNVSLFKKCDVNFTV